MIWSSHQERILRYLKKSRDFHLPTWQENPHVQRVLVNGKPDLQKVKELFAERGICNEAEFDMAFTMLRGLGLCDSLKFEITPIGFLRHEQVEQDFKVELTRLGLDKGTKQLPAQELETFKNKEY